MNPELTAREYIAITTTAELSRLQNLQARAGLMRKKKDQEIVFPKEEQERLLFLEGNLIIVHRTRRTQ